MSIYNLKRGTSLTLYLMQKRILENVKDHFLKKLSENKDLN